MNPRLSQKLRGRNNRGNTLILVLAFILLLIPISLFFLQYGRITGANQEQKTAIEGAALSASRDLTRIIVEDPYFGYVSMCDYAPSQAGTIAGDNFDTPVRSINTVLATVRLDMIVADKIDSTIMRNCSQRDYPMTISCKDRLVDALNAAILPGATAEDVDGNMISPYDDAVKAYQSNVI